MGIVRHRDRLSREEAVRASLPRRLTRLNEFDRQALAAYKVAMRRYAGRSWVTGVGIGIKERKGRLHASLGPVIVIHVARKLRRVPRSRKIPAFILGVPTDVVASNFTLSQALVAMPQAPSFPLQPGASIARATGSAASLGGIVRDAAGQRHLLTAAHVLREGKPKKDAPIVHPGPLDASGPVVTVARVDDWHLGLDAGIATLDNAIIASNVARVSHVTILPPAEAKAGDTLEKCGRTTSRTQGVVRDIGTIAGGKIGPVAFITPLVGDTQPISLEGDSGSIWYDAVTDQAKALHIGVDLGTREAVATLMTHILDELSVTWE